MWLLWTCTKTMGCDMLLQKLDYQSHFFMAMDLCTIAIGINVRSSQHFQFMSFVWYLMLKISERCTEKEKEGTKLIISKCKRKFGPRKCTIWVNLTVQSRIYIRHSRLKALLPLCASGESCLQTMTGFSLMRAYSKGDLQRIACAWRASFSASPAQTKFCSTEGSVFPNTK